MSKHYASFLGGSLDGTCKYLESPPKFYEHTVKINVTKEICITEIYQGYYPTSGVVKYYLVSRYT